MDDNRVDMWATVATVATSAIFMGGMIIAIAMMSIIQMLPWLILAGAAGISLIIATKTVSVVIIHRLTRPRYPEIEIIEPPRSLSLSKGVGRKRLPK